MLLVLLLAAASAVVAADAECTEDEREAYRLRILQDVRTAWKRPYPDRTLACTLLIKQNFRGEVLNVGIADCGDDPRVHKSFVDAAYLASPIPLPTNEQCWERDVIFRIESRG